MTRGEIRIFIDGFRVATLFQNSDCNLGFVKEILDKIPKDCSYSEQISIISKELDCNPVANVSYIYVINIENRTAYQFDVNVVKNKTNGLVWKKGKLLNRCEY